MPRGRVGGSRSVRRVLGAGPHRNEVSLDDAAITARSGSSAGCPRVEEVLKEAPGRRSDYPVDDLAVLHEEDRRCRSDVVEGGERRLIADVDLDRRIAVREAAKHIREHPIQRARAALVVPEENYGQARPASKDRRERRARAFC